MYDATYKVVIFGDAGCGKTTLTQRFLTNLFKSDTRMTIGVDFEVKSMDINAKKVKLQIWDFGGEERFRFLLPTYVRGANGALFMYDVTNYSSLAHIDDWLLVVRREIKKEQDAFPIIVVGGKADLIDDREVTGDEGINIARSRAIDGFIECSSKTGENVEETFDALTRLMMQRVRQYLGLRFAEVSQPDVKQKKS
jgi:Ras-related protein Rab-8A